MASFGSRSLEKRENMKKIMASFTTISYFQLPEFDIHHIHLIGSFWKYKFPKKRE